MVYNANFTWDLMKLIKERRSVRNFNSKRISEETIIEIIEAGVWAPTGCNNQELRFLILDKEKEINDILGFKPSINRASAVILIFCDMSLPMSRKMYIQSRFERHLPYIDTGLALANMILYAKSKSIDSCIINLSEYHFSKTNKKRSFVKNFIYRCERCLGFYRHMEENFEFHVRRHLKIPKHLKIMCGVVFGHVGISPGVREISHGGKRVTRNNVRNYIIDNEL